MNPLAAIVTLVATRRALLRGIGAAALVVVVGGLPLTPSRSRDEVARQATPVPSAPGAWRQTAGPYRLQLVIGPPEAMYTPAQIAAQHPADGEAMLSGTMAMPGPGDMSSMGMAGTAMSGMAMPTAASGGTPQHLELHVWDAATGRVVTDAQVTIDVIDQTAHRAVALPIVTMQGVREGSADFHYGNAVRLLPGHAYAIDVGVNGQRATFAVRFEQAIPAAQGSDSADSGT